MNTFSTTQTLITFVEVESALMDLAVASRFGKRQISDDEMFVLGERFWSAYYQDGFISTPALEQVFAEVNQLADKLDADLWSLAAEVETDRNDARQEIYVCEEMELELREEAEMELIHSGFDADEFTAKVDAFAKTAHQSCGCIYEVYQRRLSADIDGYIATLPATQKAEALSLARRAFDYQSAEEIAEEIRRDRENGDCIHGLDPDCCPCGCGDIE